MTSISVGFFLLWGRKEKNLTQRKIYLPFTSFQSWSCQHSWDTENFAWPPLGSQHSNKHLSCDLKQSQLRRVQSVLLFKVNKCPCSLILEVLLLRGQRRGERLKVDLNIWTLSSLLLSFPSGKFKLPGLTCLVTSPTLDRINFILNTQRWLSWSLQIAHKML